MRHKDDDQSGEIQMAIVIDIGPNLTAVFSGAGILIAAGLFIWAFMKE